MNKQEFKDKIKKEVENIELSDHPYKMMEDAFYQRQAQAEAEKTGKNKKNKLLRILSSSVISVVLITVLIIGSVILINNERPVFFNEDTRFENTTFDDISNLTNKNVNLPRTFDNGFELEALKVFFPKENEPCAIGIEYFKKLSEELEQTINVIIMINIDYQYHNKDDYDACIESFEINDIVVYYHIYSDRDNDIILAKFEINECKYYFTGTAIDLSILEIFVEILN